MFWHQLPQTCQYPSPFGHGRLLVPLQLALVFFLQSFCSTEVAASYVEGAECMFLVDLKLHFPLQMDLYPDIQHVTRSIAGNSFKSLLQCHARFLFCMLASPLAALVEQRMEATLLRNHEAVEVLISILPSVPHSRNLDCLFFNISRTQPVCLSRSSP